MLKRGSDGGGGNRGERRREMEERREGWKTTYSKLILKYE